MLGTSHLVDNIDFYFIVLMTYSLNIEINLYEYMVISNIRIRYSDCNFTPSNLGKIVKKF